MKISQKIAAIFIAVTYLYTSASSISANDIQALRKAELSRQGYRSQDIVKMSLGKNQVLPDIAEKKSVNEFSSDFDSDREASWKRYADANNAQTFSQRSTPTFPKTKNLSELEQVPTALFPKGKDNPYQIKNTDGGEMIARRMDALVTSLAQSSNMAHEHVDADPQDFMSRLLDIADLFMNDADEIYRETDAMSNEVDEMAMHLDQNYQNLAQHTYITDSIARNFNAQSDALADRVLEMIDALDGMQQQVQENILNIDDILSGFGMMTRNQASAKVYAKSLNGEYTQARDQFMQLAMAFQDKGADPENDAAQVVDYINDLKVYASELQNYSDAGSDEIEGVKDYLNQARQYLVATQGYLDDILIFLTENEAYFRSAKIEAEVPDPPPDPCASEGMTSNYQECSQNCNTVCSFNKVIDGANCFKCQQGGGETCWDVKMWPMSHPWCNGGICDTNPDLVCEQKDVTAPDRTKLSCLTCKKRPDLCANYYPQTTNLTNCKLGCWNGTCTYRGKYLSAEWTGRMEKLHCFECVTPPDPPTCEDLNWGYDYEEDCEDNCQAPGMCVEKKHTIKGEVPDEADDDGDGEDGDDDGGNDAGNEGAQAGGGGVAPQADGADKARKKTGVDDGGDKDGGKTKGPGTKPEPPKGPPQNPGGGSGPSQIAGGSPDKWGPDVEPKPKPTTPERPQTRVRPQPERPQPEKPTVNKPNPPEPPETPETIWLEKWININDALITKYDNIAKDPNESEAVQRSASRIRDSYKERNTKLKNDLQAEIDRATMERAKAEERKRAQEEYLRKRQAERAKVLTFEERERLYHLKKYKQAIKNLATRTAVFEEHPDPRKPTVDKLRRQIVEAQKELEVLKAEEKRVGTNLGGYSTQVRNNREATEKKLKKLFSQYKPLAKEVKEVQDRRDRELKKLANEELKYRMLLSTQERQREDLRRMAEYYKVYEELKHLKKTREISDRVWKQKLDDLESKIRDKKARGEDTDDLETKLENMKRGKKEWDAIYDRRQKSMEDELDDFSYNNMMIGAGPQSERHLGEQLDKYANGMESTVTALESAMNGLDPNDPMAKQLQKQLDAVKEMQSSLRAQSSLTKSDYPMDEDEIKGIVNTVYNVAEGSAKTDAPPSFMSHFVESLGEELYETATNPFYRWKKNMAYGAGLVVGTAKGIYGLGELTLGAADLAAETTARALGFKDGGIFGNDASKAFQGLAQAVDGNVNLDGVIKASAMLGGVIDKEITRISKSKNIGMESAFLGGKVLGETVLADAATAGINKLGLFDNLVAGADKAGDALRVGDQLVDGAKQAENALDSVRTSGQALDGATDAAAAGRKVQSDAARVGRNTDGGTRVRPKDAPTPTQTPPRTPTGKKPDLPDGSPPGSKPTSSAPTPNATPQPRPKQPVAKPEQPVRPDAKAPDQPNRPDRPERPAADGNANVPKDPDVQAPKVDEPKPQGKKPTRAELQAMADAKSDAGLKQAMDDMKAGRAADDLGEVGDDLLGVASREAPVGSLSKDLTPDQLKELFTPGANLSRQQIIQKADYLRAQRAAQQAGKPLRAGPLPDDFMKTSGFGGDIQDALPTQILNKADETPTQMLNNLGDNVPTQRLSPGQVQDGIGTRKFGTVGDNAPTQQLLPGQVEDLLPTKKLTPGQVQDAISTQKLKPGAVEDALGTRKLSPGQVQDGLPTQKLNAGQVEDLLPTQKLDAPKKKLSREELQAKADAASDAGLKKAMDDMKSGRAADDFGEIGDDLLPTAGREAPVGSLSKDLTPKQLEALFKPGANLTPEQLLQKADYMRAQRAAQRAGQKPTTVRQGADAGDFSKTQMIDPADITPTQRLTPGQIQDGISTQRLNPGQVQDAIPTQKLKPGQVQDGIPTQKLSPGQIQDALPTQKLNPGQVQDAISTQKLKPGQVEDMLPTQRLPAALDDTVRQTMNVTDDTAKRAQNTLDALNKMDLTTPSGQLSARKSAAQAARSADDAAMRAHKALDDIAKYDFPDSAAKASAEQSARRAASTADDAAKQAHKTLDDLNAMDLSSPKAQAAARASAQKAAQASDEAAKAAHKTLDDLNQMDLGKTQRYGSDGRPLADGPAGDAHKTLDDLNNMDLGKTQRYGPDGRPLADGPAGDAHKTLDDLNKMELDKTQRYGPDGRPLADGPAGDAHKTLDDINKTNLDDAAKKMDGVEKAPEARGPPTDKTPDGPKELEAAPLISGDQPLPVVAQRQQRLPRSHKKRLEKANGFRKDHSQKMHEFAQETDAFLIVRNGNPDSIKHMNNPNYMPKPMDSKAKTAIVGPHKGLVVDPTHQVQAKYFQDAIDTAKKAGDLDEAARIQARWDKSVETWDTYKDKMAAKGFTPNEKTGLIEYLDPVTGKRWKGLHGDYDLHGLYKRNPDGGASRVGTGAGETLEDGMAIRRQLNEKIDGRKDYVQHGAQDDWVPDPRYVPNKPPDPPATVFFPDGRPPVTLRTADEMKKFYQDEMGIKWEYPDAPKSTPGDPDGILQTLEYLEKYSFD